MPKGYLPREGDLIVLHARVKSNVKGDDAAYVYVRPVGHHANILVEFDAVVDIFARHWEEGDRVRLASNRDIIGTVFATNDAWVWLRPDPDCAPLCRESMLTVPANNLEALPPAIPDEGIHLIATLVEPPAPNLETVEEAAPADEPTVASPSP